MTKYVVKFSEQDLQMIKDCHSKNPSIMKAVEEGKKEDQSDKHEKRLEFITAQVFFPYLENSSNNPHNNIESQ